MGLFKKKKIDSSSSECKSGSGSKNIEPIQSAVSGRNIKVLGSGCSRCNALEAATKAAMSELGIYDDVEHVTDFRQIAAFGVMSTPALVIDDQVVLSGRVPKKDEIKELIKKIRG